MKRVISFRDMQKILKNNGYTLKRTHGDHFIYSNGQHTISVNIGLNRMVAKRLIKENQLVC